MVEVYPIPKSFRPGSQEVGFSDVHTIFKNANYGKKLAHSVRYDQYRPSSMTKEQWTRMLGADVNNLEHMRLTYGLTRQFIRYCNDAPEGQTRELTFSHEEQEDLLLTAIVHDWGEAVVGDITFDKKTDIDEAEEQTSIQRIISELFPETPDIRTRIHKVVTDVLPNRESKLGKAFNAIERIGYLRTGLNALGSLEEVEEENKDNLRWLTNNVLLNQIPTLLKYSEIYPPIRAFLSMNNVRVSQAFENANQDEVYDKYSEDDREPKKRSFQAAHEQWLGSTFATTAAEPVIRTTS
ncbi:HD domain-containing protein [Candidatus Woesebacteria bacterium]|nr:HD domain-containing protein [Candidatus Woesebacteria bacterium]